MIGMKFPGFSRREYVLASSSEYLKEHGGKVTNTKQKIAILGAGISGLSLAWFLNKKAPGAFDISIFDSKNRVGGWLHTIEQNGQLFECGPRSLRTAGSG